MENVFLGFTIIVGDFRWQIRQIGLIKISGSADAAPRWLRNDERGDATPEESAEVVEKNENVNNITLWHRREP